MNIVGDPVVLSPSFRPLIHRFKNIWNYTYQEGRLDEARTDLEHLLAFICDVLEDEYRIFREVEQTLEVPFSELWACFIPGEIVVTTDNDITECYRFVGAEVKPESTLLTCKPILSTELRTFLLIISLQGHQFNYAAGCRVTPWYPSLYLSSVAHFPLLNFLLYQC